MTPSKGGRCHPAPVLGVGNPFWVLVGNGQM